MNGHNQRSRKYGSLALCFALAFAACTVNPVPTPAKTSGGTPGNEDNKGVPTSYTDTTDPSKTNDGSDATQMGGAADAAPPAADASATVDGSGETSAGDTGRNGKD